MLDAWTAMVFFRFCRIYHIDRPEDRIALMREMTRRKKAKYLRDVAPILEGKKVLKVGFKLPHNPWDEHYCPDCGPKESK